MDKNQTICASCGAQWQDHQSCTDAFHQLLAWEWDNPQELFAVHHLMVLCYHLQHPHLYSPQTLQEAIRILEEFVIHNKTPGQIRKEKSAAWNNQNRIFKVTGTNHTQGSYPVQPQWQFTIQTVIEGGERHYIENVRAWADTILKTLHTMKLVS